MKRLALLVLLLFATPAHATVNEVFARNEYVVAGSGTVFPYTFKILDKVQITVMVNGVIKNLDTDYSVSGVGDSGGGAVTFVTTPGNGASVVLIRDQPVQQLSTYTANEAFPATRLMNDLDKNIMVDQMQQEEIGRALKFDPQSLFKNVFVDDPIAGQCLAWNASQTRVVSAPCVAGETVVGPVSGSGAAGQVTFWTAPTVVAGDGKLLWDNVNKSLTVGTLPIGPLKPGNTFSGLVGPMNATGMQNLMLQTVQGDPSLIGLVTLGDDRVGISSWNFRGTGATNPIYGANFGVVFNTPGVANGLEIDVQNDSTTNYIGQALWLNGSTRATGTPGTVGHRANAILIDTQDGSKWERGILFKEGFVGNGATGSIEKMGIHFEHSQDADFIVIQPRVGASANIAFKLTNPEFTVNRFELLNSGAIRVGTTMTGPAFPSYAFVEEQTTGIYLESPSVLGFAISGPLVPGPGVGGFRRMTLGTALNIYPSAATPNNTGTLNLWDQFSAHSVGFMAPDFVGNSFRIQLPNAPGFSGQCLVTNGAFPIETWSYAACGSGGPGGGTVTNTGVLTLNALILGDGGVAVKSMSSLGTTTTVLHGNASGVPTFGPVMVPDIGATGTPSATTFLRGDGTWSTPPGTGTVTTSGSPVSGQVAFMTSSTAISGAPELTWSGSNILTLGTGTSVSLYSIKTALLNEIKHGTAAAPVTTLGPTTKISKIQNYTTIPMAGCTVGTNGQIDAECGATLLVHNQSLSSSLQQGTAIAGYSSGDNSTTGGGSGDQVGVIGLGRKAGGTGVATGSYFEGQRFAAGSGVVAGGILAFGSEIRHTNMTAIDCFYDGSIPTCASVWLSAGGTPGVKKGVGAMVFDTDTVATMQAGFACSVKSVASPGACFDDNSVGSGSGIRIGGSKSVGIEEVSTSIIGMRLLGTYSSNEAIRMKQGNLIAWQNVPGTATIFINGDATNKQLRVGGDLVLEHSTAAAKLYLLDQGSATHFTRMDAGTGAGGFTLNTTVGGVLNKRIEINTLGQFFYTPTPTVGTFGFAANGTRRTEVQFHTNNNTNAVSLIAPATATDSHVWTLPSTFGATGDVLTNTGGGVLAWTASGGITGTGASNHLTFWSSASVATSSANHTTDGNTLTLGAGSSGSRPLSIVGFDAPLDGAGTNGGHAWIKAGNGVTPTEFLGFTDSFGAVTLGTGRFMELLSRPAESARPHSAAVFGMIGHTWDAGVSKPIAGVIETVPGALNSTVYGAEIWFEFADGGAVFGGSGGGVRFGYDASLINWKIKTHDQPGSSIAFQAPNNAVVYSTVARLVGAATPFFEVTKGLTVGVPTGSTRGDGTINTSVGYYTNNAAPVMPSLAGAGLRLVTVSAAGQLGSAAIVSGFTGTLQIRDALSANSDCSLIFSSGILTGSDCTVP